jgi:hypothetical protein
MQYVLCSSLENSPQTNPIIGRIDCKAGHGAGRPTQKMVTVLVSYCFCLGLHFLYYCLKLIIFVRLTKRLIGTVLWQKCWELIGLNRCHLVTK